MSPPPGEARFLSELPLIERVIAFVCSRHHLSAADADDFGSHVKLKFVENDYDILRKFEGRSSLRTYLTVVIQRLFLDYRISAWGKWRPSAEASRNGPVAVLLEQLLVRDGFGFEEACELLAARHDVKGSRAELETLAAALPIRVKRRFESEDALSTVPSAAPGADAAVIDHERQAMAERVSASMHRLMTRFEVQDRLIMTMRFVDGRTVAEIAAVLRLEQKPLYRRIDRLLKELREGLEAEGLERAAVLEILESPAVSIEWRRETEIDVPRPSMGQGAR